MGYRCPGQSDRNLKVELIRCPHCGYELEIFSDELRVNCPSCGKPVYRERLPSCIDWCAAAALCLGPERWEQLRSEREEFHKVKKVKGENRGEPMAEGKITGDSLLGEVIKRYPQTEAIFKKYGMPDYAEERLPMEKLSFFAGVHRVDLEKLLEELNRAVEG